MGNGYCSIVERTPCASMVKGNWYIAFGDGKAHNSLEHDILTVKKSKTANRQMSTQGYCVRFMF